MRTIHLTAALLPALLMAAGSALFAQSSNYTPTLQGNPIPAQAHELELIVAAAGFPETRPETVDRMISYGADLAVRYRLNAGTRLGIRAYMDLSGVPYAGGQRGGLGAEVAWRLGDTAKAPGKGLVARVQTVYNGNSVEGVGFGLSFVVQPGGPDGLVPYLALGPFIGLGQLDGPAPIYDFVILPEEYTRSQWGYGVLANVGATVRAGRSVDIFLELAGGMQFNEWESITSPFIAPAAGIVWRL